MQNSGQCPTCGTSNPYTNANCSKCGARLPWADALGMGSSSGDGQAVQSFRFYAGLMLTFIIISLLVAFGFMGYMWRHNLAPPPPSAQLPKAIKTK